MKDQYSIIEIVVIKELIHGANLFGPI